MAWKSVLLIIFFYFLALFQVSFFNHFYIRGFNFNLILLFVVLINLFFLDIHFGFLSALAGGFFWDVFSSQFFGYHILILIIASAFIHFVLRKYIRYPA